MQTLNESVVEYATLAWLENFGYLVKHDPKVAPGELTAERRAYDEPVFAGHLRDALVWLNLQVPAEALISGDLRAKAAERIVRRQI